MCQGVLTKRYSVVWGDFKGWQGYIWQGRFSSCPIDEDYLLVAVKYIEQNSQNLAR